MVFEVGDPGARALVRVSRSDIALLRAAAALAQFSEPRRRAEHLVEPLSELADRMEAELEGLKLAA